MSSIKDIFEWQQHMELQKAEGHFAKPPKRFIRRGRSYKVISRQLNDFFRLNEIVKLVDYDEEGYEPYFAFKDGSYPDEVHRMHWTEVVPS